MSDETVVLEHTTETIVVTESVPEIVVLESGMPGARGPAGGGASAALVHDQAAPSASWLIPHTFGRLPAVALYGTDGALFGADVTATTSAVTVTLSVPTAGKAILT